MRTDPCPNCAPSGIHPSGTRRRARRAAIPLLAVVALTAVASGCSNAIWYVSPEFGEKKAEKDNKPILYYFKSWDSTLHRNMLKNVLRDPRVDRELRETINIELEYGFFDDQSERFKIRKPQVCVFAAPDGSRLTPNYSVTPVPTPEAFLEWLKDAKSKAPQLAKPTTPDAAKSPDSNSTPNADEKPAVVEPPAAPPQKME